MKSRNIPKLLLISLCCLIMIAAAWFAFPSEPPQVSAPPLQAEELHLHPPPVEPIIRREGHTVRIEMTAQQADIEISEGVTYPAWTFNGTAPGPVLRVKQGDQLEFTLKNLDPDMPHSMDFHAVHAAPNKKFIDVMPNEHGTFTYPATTPGVFMYHCGVSPVLLHVANGMYGMIIVEPTDGYPTDSEIDREYTIVQSEWYAANDLDAFQQGDPEVVVFNGDDFTLKDHPFLAKVGDQVRLYVINAGPNHVSSFHVVGTTFDRVYLDGNPNNQLYGMQTVLLPAGGGAVVEFTVTEEGDYPILTHQLRDANLGATAILRVTQDGTDHGAPVMSH
ncbi:multicopper oxidase domain-containing protein [Paenibacillus barengoltzii]|uniref:multicopper oxidase domain-containing protein n=1 Tax=Paenibacillus barengoltzii TaxID=343517 RepID=UPI000FD8CC25|nr:multicopper oxidase domain-containing protein [Paenibacillus barengoltzii]MEC2344759.1 multicopper oxidase domain-containing protein [Paenibacillus barengoltzii]